MLDFWENDEKGLKCFFSLQFCQDFIKSFYKVGVKKNKKRRNSLKKRKLFDFGIAFALWTAESLHARYL